MRLLTIVGLIIAALVLWIVFDVLKGALTKVAPRRPEQADDGADYAYDKLQRAVWYIEHYNNIQKPTVELNVEEPPEETFALTAPLLLEYIRLAAAYMAKRYDCADFRAIWLCKLRYALVNSDQYRNLLTNQVDGAIKEALTNFKYWLTSPGADSMCYYSENHQMVFAVSEYFAGAAYPEAVFAIDGRSGREHMDIAAARMNNWFDQRGRYGFSEFLSSNYLAVDIGALSMLLTYCGDSKLCAKAETALNMIFLDYALQMYDLAFTGPAGRNYARNNTSFMASTASHAIVDKVWGMHDEDSVSGFTALFISLIDSRKYSVPVAIVSLGRDNSKGIIRTTSGLTLKEMQQNNLIGQSDYQLMFQLGMGALSNEEVIENTLKMLDRTDMVHNNFVASFRYFNIRLLRLLGLTRTISGKLDPFSNGMAIQRNEVYTYCCGDYKLATNQMYFPGSYGAQQLQQMACLPEGINVFTANPMKRKEFQGYGVAPCAAQDMNCMMSIHNIPEKNILLATGETRHYTATYFPEEKFEEVAIDGNYAFGRARGTYIAVIGASPLKYETYAGPEEFEKITCDTYNFYDGRQGPYVDSFRLKDWTKGFELRQQGNRQFTVYEMGSGANETFTEFMARVKGNRIEFADNVLRYTTRSADLKSEAAYVLDYAGTFTVNGQPVSNRHDRYDSRFVHAGRDAERFTVEHGGASYTFDLTKMYILNNPKTIKTDRSPHEIQHSISQRR